MNVRSAQSSCVRFLFRMAPAVFAFAFLFAFVVPVHAQYTRTDLVSNQQGVAPLQDTHLVNGWGLVSLAGSPYWVSDNGTGFSTLYAVNTSPVTQVQLFVMIPPAPSDPADTLGTPSGVVGNIDPNPNDFNITVNDKSAAANFIFATLDGTISAWSMKVSVIDPGTHLSEATLKADRSGAGATYTGLAIAVNSSNQAFLYAADDGPNRRVDMFNSSFTFVTSFSDPEIPKEFAPYGIQAIDGQIWVTYTALNKGQGGFVDVFDTSGVLLKHDAVHGPLHSPWGLAKAPGNFGPMSNAILVTNNIPRGRIDAFDSQTGQFLGPLRDANGNPIEIDDIWAIQFGQGGAANGPLNQLFFTAGPNGYANGLFGTITLDNNASPASKSH